MTNPDVPTKAYVCPKIDEDECACAFGDKEEDSLYVCYCHGELGVPHVRMIERSALEELERENNALGEMLQVANKAERNACKRAAEMVRDIACEDFSQEDAKPLFDLADRIEKGEGDTLDLAKAMEHKCCKDGAKWEQGDD